MFFLPGKLKGNTKVRQSGLPVRSAKIRHRCFFFLVDPYAKAKITFTRSPQVGASFPVNFLSQPFLEKSCFLNFVSVVRATRVNNDRRLSFLFFDWLFDCYCVEVP